MDEQKYKEFPLFQHMQEKEIHEILLTAGCFVKNFKKGNYIYQENEVIHSLGVILTGHVYIDRKSVV